MIIVNVHEVDPENPPSGSFVSKSHYNRKFTDQVLERMPTGSELLGSVRFCLTEVLFNSCLGLQLHNSYELA
jgi:hypothetical protein